MASSPAGRAPGAMGAAPAGGEQDPVRLYSGAAWAQARQADPSRRLSRGSWGLLADTDYKWLPLLGRICSLFMHPVGFLGQIQTQAEGTVRTDSRAALPAWWWGAGTYFMSATSPILCLERPPISAAPASLPTVAVGEAPRGSRSPALRAGFPAVSPGPAPGSALHPTPAGHHVPVPPLTTPAGPGPAVPGRPLSPCASPPPPAGGDPCCLSSLSPRCGSHRLFPGWTRGRRLLRLHRGLRGPHVRTGIQWGFLSALSGPGTWRKGRGRHRPPALGERHSE